MKQQTNPTPLEKLQVEKERVRHLLQQQEHKLNEDLSYLQENAGVVLLSGLTSFLFPGSKGSKKKALPADKQSQAVQAPMASYGFADFLSIGKMMIPVLWEIMQPLIITWGIRKLKTAFAGKNKKL
jgi:hypothetical protein